MTIAPSDRDQLTKLLNEAHQNGGHVSEVDLGGLNHLVEHTPEDMTATVEGGMPIDVLQAKLREHGQWLPIDPPGSDTLTINSLIANNESGPRRFGYGTIREHLIGITAALADGRFIRSGGKVVKNVAGYDLMKLFVGNRQTLGIIVEATFRLRPLPEKEVILRHPCPTLEAASEKLEAILESGLDPIVLDLYRLPSSDLKDSDVPFDMVVGFAGSHAEVDWQVEQAEALGITTRADLEYDRQIRRIESRADLRKRSVLPSRIIEAIRESGEVSFVARLGNGILYYYGTPAASKPDLPTHLFQRIKAAYDPNNVFPSLSYDGDHQ